MTRGSCATSASPATACASPACTCARCERFPFDSVLFPYNHSLLDDPAYRADVEALVELCAARAGGRCRRSRPSPGGRWAADFAGPRFSWYQPLEDPDAIARAVRYVLSDERLFLNTTSDARLLPLIVAGASGRPDPPDRRRAGRRRRRRSASPRCSTAATSSASEVAVVAEIDRSVRDSPPRSSTLVRPESVAAERSRGRRRSTCR